MSFLLTGLLLAALATLGVPMPRLLFATPFYIAVVANARHDFLTSTLRVAWSNAAIIIALISATVNPFPLSGLAWGIGLAAGVGVTSFLSGGRLIGMGDARLLAALAVWQGSVAPERVWWTICIALFVQVVALAVKAITSGVRFTDTLPFGPALVAGCACTDLFA
ncbi:prepilin signal peptidase PulO-like enzyme (type II secretory pathway) [Arcanobacterium wilhelmae]|uniref:Prepilin signal peptidase PulO-like enzyme (Type II secretory pathway) n=1 Tax=Arcanobacterium wilhelmae TaxID=1803177 RepID=A0ABT9N8K9_9ACTO|nr:hypothetical protein [Arcanobacterium wilhelmae]MDP9800038.1 prepilin signal peptidase PulO-like enzyme (type II secretory pathway) [Arcanobacterium wilhelmae]WFN89533.1 hypothetical protein P8A24_04800 [Arcanobacterium wilhelmae]